MKKHKILEGEKCDIKDAEINTVYHHHIIKEGKLLFKTKQKIN